MEGGLEMLALSQEGWLDSSLTPSTWLGNVITVPCGSGNFFIALLPASAARVSFGLPKNGSRKVDSSLPMTASRSWGVGLRMGWVLEDWHPFTGSSTVPSLS